MMYQQAHRRPTRHTFKAKAGNRWQVSLFWESALRVSVAVTLLLVSSLIPPQDHMQSGPTSNGAPTLLGVRQAQAATFNGGWGCFANPQIARLAIQTATLTPSTIAAGITITGTGFQPFVSATLYNNAAVPFAGTDEGSTPFVLTVHSDGTFTTTIPASWVTASTVDNTNYAIAAEDQAGNCATLSGITEGPGQAIPDDLGGTQQSIILDSGSFTGTLNVAPNSTFQSIQVTFPVTVEADAIFTATIDTSPNNNNTVVQGSPETLLGFTPGWPINPVSPFNQLLPGTPLTVNLPGSLQGMNVHSVVITVPLPGGGTVTGAFGVRYLEPTPALTYVHSARPPFSDVTVSGSGFGGSTSGTTNAVTITGTAFAAGSVDPSTIPLPATDISGTWTATFPLTATGLIAGGTIVFTATDLAGATASNSFVVAPLTTTTPGALITLISSNPCPLAAGASASALGGQSVPIVLSGFVSSEPVNLSVAGQRASAIGTTDLNGNLISDIVPVALSGLSRSIPFDGLPGDQGIAAASYPVSAIGQTSGTVASTYLSSCPSNLIAAPDNAGLGGTTIITGTGFAANSQVTLTDYIYSTALTSTASPGVVPANGSTNNGGTPVVYTVSTDAAGFFTAPITLPGTLLVSAGNYTVRAQDSSGIVATTEVGDGILIAPPTATPSPTATALPTSTPTPLQSVVVNVQPGWNLIDFPLVPTTTLYAQTILSALVQQSGGSFVELASWVNNGWTVALLNNNAPVGNFAVTAIQGYFLYSDKAGSYTLMGQPLPLHAQSIRLPSLKSLQAFDQRFHIPVPPMGQTPKRTATSALPTRGSRKHSTSSVPATRRALKHKTTPIPSTHLPLKHKTASMLPTHIPLKHVVAPCLVVRGVAHGSSDRQCSTSRKA